MADPLPYLLTWTCYGTWLHGDERGSVDLDHNIPGEPRLPLDVIRVRRELQLLRGAPVGLDDSARRIIAKTIEEHCTVRRWEALAVNVRTNHVHVVVAAGDTPPERVMNDFKAWSTRRLREAGFFGFEVRIWTRHGSTRYLNDPAAVDAARMLYDDCQSEQRNQSTEMAHAAKRVQRDQSALHVAHEEQ